MKSWLMYESCVNVLRNRYHLRFEGNGTEIETGDSNLIDILCKRGSKERDKPNNEEGYVIVNVVKKENDGDETLWGRKTLKHYQLESKKAEVLVWNIIREFGVFK